VPQVTDHSLLTSVSLFSLFSAQMILLRAQIRTDLVDDCFIIPVRDAAATVQWLLAELLIKYNEWHPFKVYEFEISNVKGRDSEIGDDGNVLLLEALDISESDYSSNTMKQHILCDVVETEGSKQKRKEDEEKEEQMRLERLRIEKEKKEKRQKRMAEIAVKANCWELEKYSQFLNVPLERDPKRDKHIQGDLVGVHEDDGGQIVENTGSLDQWCSIRFATVILPSFNKFFYSIKVLTLPSTTNTWKMCIGAVPMEFNIEADRHWIGSQHSWSYISGTGGKCHNSGKSVNYGEKYSTGDVISVLLDFDDGTITFFKNGKSQGIAFKALKAAVIPAVSLTAKGCRVKMLDLVNEKHLPSKYKPFMVKNVEIMRNYVKQRQHYLSNEFEKEQTEIWNRQSPHGHRVNMLYPRFSSYRYPPSLHFKSSLVKSDGEEESICNVVVNNGSGDKWRMAKSFGAYYPNDDDVDHNVVAFQFDVIRDGKSSNTWRLCLGVVPIEYDITSDKVWVGAQSSWSYIAGTGGKCFNSAQSNSYGERYSTGDKIAIVLDFKAQSIEFFKNGESQGIAFEDCESLNSGVYAACSMTGANTAIMFNSLSASRAQELQMKGKQKREMLQNVMDQFGNIWDGNKMTNDGLKLIDSMCVASEWDKDGKDPWKCAASLLSYQTGRRYFEMELMSLPKNSSNKWKICVGVIPKSFNVNHSKQKLWIGAQGSWSLIVGIGGKCHSSSKSTQYTNESFATKDRIGVLMDFDNHTLEFYKNDRSLGEAFNNLYGPVYAAISIATNHCKVRFRPEAEQMNMERLFLFS